jgi:TetR/AcrR family transcriptional regulator
MKNDKYPLSGTAQKILDAAREEFSKSGLAGARVDRIASRAGVNKAMIYYHFRSKEDLYQTVIDEHLTRVGQFISQNLRAQHSPEDFLANITLFIDTMFRERRTFVPIFLREMASGGERIKDVFGRLMRENNFPVQVQEMLDQGKKEGRFRQLDSRHAIMSFIGMNLYYQLMAPIFNSIWEIEDENQFREQRRKEIVDLFLYGLMAR